jgi:hypothetical protein
MPDTPPNFGLPDRGELLESMAHSVAGESVAATVHEAVARVRRPDGTLVLDDLRTYRTTKDGPLYALNMILSLDVFRVSAWAQGGFSMFQKRSAVRTVEDLCRREGIDSAVAWALSNGQPERLHVDVLRELMEEFVHSDKADMIRRILQKSLFKWH